MSENTNTAQEGSFLFSMTNQTKEIEFRVQSFTGLGMFFNEVSNHWGGQEDKRPSGKLNYNDIELQVILDEDYVVLQQLYDFLHQLKNPETQEINWTYDFSGVLSLLSNRNQFKKIITFDNCWIKSMGDITLNSSHTSVDPVLIPVTVSYNLYKMSDAS